MKLNSVHENLSCTQMQQSWHKPWPTHIKAKQVMNVTFCKAKQCQADIEKNPTICTLYEARAHAVQDYSFKLQLNLKEGFSSVQAYMYIYPDSSKQYYSRSDDHFFWDHTKGVCPLLSEFRA